MPRGGWVKPQDDQRLSDHVALGVLTRTFPPALVDAVLADTGRTQQRSRLLPARLVTYYVMALALFSSQGYEEVMRNLVEGLAWKGGWRQSWTVPSQPALSQARARLGAEPLAKLFARACVPLADPSTPGAFWRGWRLVGMDGSTLDVTDTPGNVEAFGKPGSGRGSGEGAFPQLRVVGLAECGTHAIFAASFGAYATAEITLARDLAARLSRGMLVFADRGFCAHPLFSLLAKTGADLCWRAKSNAVLAVLERHGDGSFASEMVAHDDRRTRKHVTPVRVVEYEIADPGRPQSTDTRYRLVTTILDPKKAPAGELAALYAQRWEFESALDEMKSHQRGPRVVLRSKAPEGVRQEAWGYLCAHYAIRALMSDAASDQGVDPDRISFTRSLNAARRSVRSGLGAQVSTLAVALDATIAEICRELVPLRRLRAAARVVKRKMSNYGVKRAEHRSWPQPTCLPGQAIAILHTQGTGP